MRFHHGKHVLNKHVINDIVRDNQIGVFLANTSSSTAASTVTISVVANRASLTVSRPRHCEVPPLPHQLGSVPNPPHRLFLVPRKLAHSAVAPDLPPLGAKRKPQGASEVSPTLGIRCVAGCRGAVTDSLRPVRCEHSAPAAEKPAAWHTKCNVLRPM